MSSFEGYNPPVDRCYFCNGSNFRPHSEATYWQEFPLHFVECKTCRLIFANPMPNLQTIHEGNRALNIYHQSRGTLSQYRGGKEFALSLKKIAPEGILLDVGCAEGFFLLGVQENSRWKAEGVEIIYSAVEFARTRLGITVYHGTLDTLDNMSGRFDFIRMNNVIEHVQHPLRFLEKAHQLLKTSGRIYCSTPNGFQDGHFLKTANKHGLRFNLLENHFFYYPPKTLWKMFETCGFKIIRHYCEDISHSLNDFGISPRFKYPHENQRLTLSAFKNKLNEDFQISDEEIRSFKNHPQLKTWKLRLHRFRKEVFALKYRPCLPIGHQQLVYAEKARGDHSHTGTIKNKCVDQARSIRCHFVSKE
ncbi:MAG: class I SAM-dependent methyltransferase [candidate division KSB1 bacterium]|nr:class I SAM-dependent methyltransferase [candidate division KSB1 bacterium]MDZ7368579.1 class I SAM-dependent methyltransferase [candidate division KSB1 bacterium]MDZ7406384.1 class I SAM-dependent methyltransferase [candidate division KSB1 bacterium]